MYPRSWALPVAIPPRLPIWQKNTSSGASNDGFVTPYLALNSSGCILKASWTVATTRIKDRNEETF